MNKRIAAPLAMVLALVWGLADLAIHYPALPDRVPSHFGPSGAANAWMDKQTFAGTNIGLLLGISILFAGIGFLLRYIPSDAINLPNRDYWLAPERRAQTLETLGNQMLAFGAVIEWFLVAVLDLVYRAALTPTPQLDNSRMVLYLAALLGFTTLWSVQIIRRFRLPT